MITRALGTDPDVQVDVFATTAKPGDLYLLCSDGLSDMVAADVIAETLRKHRGDLNAAARALVRAAKHRGGDDNITAVLFEIVEGEAAPEPDEKTREYQTPAPDEEDTLHPEDRVPAVDTMVVPADRVAAALAHQDAQAGETGAHEAGIVRRLLALLVIVALIVVIVVLVWWGLAR